MSKIKLICLLAVVLFPGMIKAQQSVTLQSELRQLSDLSLLPAYRLHAYTAMESTYDRTGGNDDGGGYSFVRRNPDSSLVMLDVDGPGVLNRLWTPTPTRDTLDFYIDHAAKPALSICYRDLFHGEVYPFVPPLCGNGVGGYYAYFPILFQSHLMVVCRGHFLRYHQFQYRIFPKGTKVQSFALPLGEADSKALAAVSSAWTHPALAGSVHSARVAMAPGETGVLFQTFKGGRINELTIDTSGSAHLRLRITWNNERLPAIDCPLREFFGYAFGKPAMQGLLCGTDNVHYARFPMPFDRGAKIELVNEGHSPVTITARIIVEARKRKPGTEGRFYARYTSEALTKADPYHVFLAIKGKGHYVGTVLKAVGTFDGMTTFFEGDDLTTIDGVKRINGTGSEDYFNGGWYDMKGRWDHAQDMPLSGCLGYGRQPAHTGGYRFFIGDKISFEKSIWNGIEHGDSAKEGIPATYTSVAYYYCDRDQTAQQP